jgi:Orsellinic acid/F9775 biosynthesis cluster protein D
MLHGHTNTGSPDLDTGDSDETGQQITPGLSQLEIQYQHLIPDVVAEMQFLSHPYLDQLHLKINAEFHFLICQLCQEAIPTKEAQGHISNKHPELSLSFNKTHFYSIVKDLAIIPADLPANISGPRKPVHGLLIHDTIACGHCSSIFGKLTSMQNHHRSQHCDLPMPSSWRSCKGQHMKSEGVGMHRTFWEVIADEEVLPKSSRSIMVEQLMKEVNKELNMVQVPSDHRLVSPWLLTTQWHKYVESYNTSIEVLRGRVAFPQPQEEDYYTLIHSVELYFQKAVDLIENTDELVLQRLNSPDPIKK